MARDAGGRNDARVFAILARKGRLRSTSPMGAMLTAEALREDTGLAEQILHRADH